MKFRHATASVSVPDGLELEAALARTTHLGIGAHADDLEIMAFHGIRICFDAPDQWFGGVTCTNGSGSARMGEYASFSDEEMMHLRRQEQDRAALLGRYGFMAQLDFPSRQIKNPQDHCLENDLYELLLRTRPKIVYTHNPADKHDTHIAVVVPVIRALRRMSPESRPEQVYGCEVWRDLDWMMDEDKAALDVSDTPEQLGKQLVDVFDSQITGGKRYDEAAFGRRRANATFYRSHEVDNASQIVFAMNLTPLVQNEKKDILDYVNGHIDRFRRDVENKLKTQLGI